MSIVSSKLMLSSGAYHTEIVLFKIADIKRKRSSFAIFKSEIVLGIILKQSRSLFVSMFQSLMFSLDAAKRYSEFLSSSKVKLVIAELSIGVVLILVNYSRSQYFTVLSVDPLARARFYGLY